MSFLLSVLKDCKITRVSNAVAAGTSAVDGSSVDMQDYDGVCFVALLNTVVSGAQIDLGPQESSDNVSFGATVAAAQTPTVTDSGGASSNKFLVSEVYRPAKRYVRPELRRQTQNVTVDGIIAIQFRGRVKPSVDGSLASALATGV
jgi:hypothetical protein